MLVRYPQYDKSQTEWAAGDTLEEAAFAVVRDGNGVAGGIERLAERMILLDEIKHLQ